MVLYDDDDGEWFGKNQNEKITRGGNFGPGKKWKPGVKRELSSDLENDVKKIKMTAVQSNKPMCDYTGTFTVVPANGKLEERNGKPVYRITKGKYLHLSTNGWFISNDEGPDQDLLIVFVVLLLRV